jgi:hypothetical protein
MYNVELLILLLSGACFLFMVIGLFKPWIMLWWEDVQNRKKIIQVYGSLAVLFLAVYWLLKFF